MTDQPKPCRSTQHCAVHGFCHRCTPSLDDATAHLVEAIDAAGIEYPTASRVYAQLAATVRDAARTAARQTTGQDDTEAAPWTADGRHGPTPEEASAAIEQCGKWGGCILDASHTGPHRHTPRPADVEPYDHPAAAPAVGQPAEAHDTDEALTPRGLLLDILAHTSSAYLDEHFAPDEELGNIADYLIKLIREENPTEARPPRVQWRVEGYDADVWLPVSRSFASSADAHARKRVSKRYPDMPTRVVRETTTWTVEDER